MAWRLDTLNPGSSTTISVAISGLSKGDWTDTDVFFRGNGEIIGATKIDEKILDEIRKTEALSALRKEISEVNHITPDTNEVIVREVTTENQNTETINVFGEYEEEVI